MAILRAATKFFLRRYKKNPHETGMRAVLLGDSVSNRVILDGLFERYLLLALEREVFTKFPEQAIALDIGANIGNHTSFMANRFSKVIAFEPNPIVFHVLMANTFGRNIECHNIGLSDRIAQLPFVINFPNYGLAHIATEGEAADISVDVRPLDELMPSLALERLDFIKLDVEGHEYEALHGARSTISRFKPVIAMEAMYRLDPALGEGTLSLLEDIGYRHFYEFAPSPGLPDRLTASGFTSASNPLRYLFPESYRKAVSLKPVPNLRGRDNHLAVLSTEPLV